VAVGADATTDSGMPVASVSTSASVPAYRDRRGFCWHSRRHSGLVIQPSTATSASSRRSCGRTEPARARAPSASDRRPPIRARGGDGSRVGGSDPPGVVGQQDGKLVPDGVDHGYWHNRHRMLQDFATTSEIVMILDSVPVCHLLPLAPMTSPAQSHYGAAGS